MGQTADQLRQEIDAKREGAGQKIGAIEAKVEGTVQHVKDTVDDTVESAKGTVDETVQKMKESVDLVKQIEDRPLVALGVALAGGYLLGKLSGDDDGDQRPNGQSGGARPSGNAGGIRGAVNDSGLEDTLSTAIGAVMGMLTERVRSVVDETFPDLAEKITQPGAKVPPPSAAGAPTPPKASAGPVPPAPR